VLDLRPFLVTRERSNRIGCSSQFAGRAHRREMDRLKG
jgi:hypothetical protein